MQHRLIAAILAPVLLAACGGGGGDASNPAPATPPAPSYQFKPPKAGAHLVYAATLVDNLNNTVNRSVTMDITAVNADGSFAVHEEDPSHDTVVSGVTDQTLYPADYQYNPAGQPTGWTVATPSGSVRCTVSGAAGAPATLASGASWNTSYTTTCGGGAGTAYTQSGTLAGIENVTVPAGTFAAWKFVVTTTSTTNGITRVETTTRWRDSAGSEPQTVKEASVFTYSGGTPPAGAPVQQVRQLQSRN
jgi:hypothetical protein